MCGSRAEHPTGGDERAGDEHQDQWDVEQIPERRCCANRGDPAAIMAAEILRARRGRKRMEVCFRPTVAYVIASRN
jgi:hypothetical protein